MTAEARTRRSRIGSSCASIGAALCLWSALAGCLNPVPDEFPANRDGAEGLGPREASCLDNPYIVDCVGPRPESNDNGSSSDNANDPATPSAGDGEPNLDGQGGGPQNPANPDAGTPDAGGTPTPDADVTLP